MTDKSLRDEAADLVTEAVRDLRDNEVAEALRDLRAEVEKLRAEREAHTCHGCHCGGHGFHAHCNWGHCGCWISHGYCTTLPASPVSPYWNICGDTFTVTTTNVASGGWVNAASGYNPAITSSFTN